MRQRERERDRKTPLVTISCWNYCAHNATAIVFINSVNTVSGGGGGGGWGRGCFPFQKQACSTADSWFMSGRRLCLDRLTSLSAHVNSIITEVHVGYLHGIVPAAALINASLMSLSSPPTPQTSMPQHAIWHSSPFTWWGPLLWGRSCILHHNI